MSEILRVINNLNGMIEGLNHKIYTLANILFVIMVASLIMAVIAVKGPAIEEYFKKLVK